MHQSISIIAELIKAQVTNHGPGCLKDEATAVKKRISISAVIIGNKITAKVNLMTMRKPENHISLMIGAISEISQVKFYKFVKLSGKRITVRECCMGTRELLMEHGRHRWLFMNQY